MKRGQPLARRTSLARGAGTLRRSEGLARGSGSLRASEGLQRAPRKRKASIPAKVRAAVKSRDQGRCIMCEKPITAGLFGYALHHVFPEREWPELVTDPRNVVLLCPGCHDGHERALPRIPARKLPLCVHELVTDGPRTVYFERTYPS